MFTADKLRTFALSLPATEEHHTWGHPTFRVRGRIFTSLPNHGGVVVVKATPADQEVLIAHGPETYSSAPNVGRYGWVEVQLRSVLADDLRDLATRAWASVAPRRLCEAHPELTAGKS